MPRCNLRARTCRPQPRSHDPHALHPARSVSPACCVSDQTSRLLSIRPETPLTDPNREIAPLNSEDQLEREEIAALRAYFRAHLDMDAAIYAGTFADAAARANAAKVILVRLARFD